MKKYVYENATVYITIPNEQQVENIRKSTERFVKVLLSKGLIKSAENRRDNRRTGGNDIDAARRDS